MLLLCSLQVFGHLINAGLTTGVFCWAWWAPLLVWRGSAGAALFLYDWRSELLSLPTNIDMVKICLNHIFCTENKSLKITEYLSSSSRSLEESKNRVPCPRSFPHEIFPVESYHPLFGNRVLQVNQPNTPGVGYMYLFLLILWHMKQLQNTIKILLSKLFHIYFYPARNLSFVIRLMQVFLRAKNLAFKRMTRKISCRDSDSMHL